MKSTGILFGACFILSPIIFSIFRNYHDNIVFPYVFFIPIISLFFKDYEFESNPEYFI